MSAAGQPRVPGPRPRAPRGTLSAEHIVDTACELAARTGLEAVSMPGLARQLGVVVSGLYWYFRTKDDLLRAMADRVTTEFYAGLDTDTGADGGDPVLRHFRSYWTRLRDNPLWREVFIKSFGRTIGGSPEAAIRAARVHQRMVTGMTGLGLTLAEATTAYTILSAYTRGYVLVEHLGSTDTPPDGNIGFTASAADLQDYARINDLVAGADPEDSFDTGLRALWKGLLEAR